MKHVFYRKEKHKLVGRANVGLFSIFLDSHITFFLYGRESSTDWDKIEEQQYQVVPKMRRRDDIKDAGGKISLEQEQVCYLL